MIISKYDLKKLKSLKLKSDQEISNEDLKQIDGFINLNSCLAIVDIKYIDGMDLAVCNIHVEGEMKIKSTRTLNPIDFHFSNSDEVTYSFSSNEDLDDESIIKIEGSEISLHQEIVSLIVTSLPTKIIGENEPESISGESWEIISEDEYNARKENNNSPFASLKDLDLD